MDRVLDLQSKIKIKIKIKITTKECFISHSLHLSCSGSPSLLSQVLNRPVSGLLGASISSKTSVKQDAELMSEESLSLIISLCLSAKSGSILGLDSLSFSLFFIHFCSRFLSVCWPIATCAQEVNDSHCQHGKE